MYTMKWRNSPPYGNGWGHNILVHMKWKKYRKWNINGNDCALIGANFRWGSQDGYYTNRYDLPYTLQNVIFNKLML